MGNSEIKALTQTSPVIASEIHKAHEQFLAYGRDFSLDRSAFGLLFDTSRVSFELVDQLFGALDVDASGTLDFPELAIGLVAGCEDLNLKEKLDIIFDSIDINGDGELTLEEVTTTLSRFLVNVVGRIRGMQKSEGKTVYADRRCSGCREAPVNLVYECVECNRGSALGIPITVHLCKNCVHYFEGYGLGSHDMLHTRSHTMKKALSAPNPHVVTHPGAACSACEMFPIVGTRYRCLDCLDFVNLCENCYQEGEEPRAHKSDHNVEALTKASSLDAEVKRLIEDLFRSTDTNDDGQITRSEFHFWGTNSEVAASLLRGFNVQYAKFCPYLEECSMVETTVANVAAK